MLYDAFETHLETARSLLLARAHQRKPNPALPVHMPGDYLNFLGESLPDARTILEEIITTEVRCEVVPKQSLLTGGSLFFGLKFNDMLHDEPAALALHDALEARLRVSHLNSTNEGHALIGVLTFLEDATTVGVHAPEPGLTPSSYFIDALRESFECVIAYLRSLPAAMPQAVLA